jgi:murein DD-endopeptidase MepM/ murein hydrolase activator NlpD
MMFPPRAAVSHLVVSAVIVGTVVTGLVSAAQKTLGSPLQVSALGPSEALYPGAVGLVVVKASRPLAALEGEAFDRAVYFWPADAPGEWHGLVGVGLETRPGTHVLRVKGSSPDGGTAAAAASLSVGSRSYETRRLRVAANLVDPPDEEAARIARDTKAMADAFAVVGPDRLWRGAFEPPVPGAATSSFGRLSIMNGQPRGRHQGTDFRAAEGTPVVAPNAGRIALAQDLYFAGNTVIVDHGLGVFSLVAHLSRIAVGVGDMVVRGERLGLTGATGRVTGPHLHWAVRFGPLSVDPLALMSAAANEDTAQPVR